MDQQSASPAASSDSARTPNPGQATGIISVILAFVGLAPFGLVLAIISAIQSKKAKASTLLGIIGILINTVAVFVLAFLIIIISTHYSGIQEAAKNADSKNAAGTVAKLAESYYAAHRSYPQSVKDFEKDASSSLAKTRIHVTAVPPTDDSTIMYRACGLAGAQIIYFSSEDNLPVSSYLGDGDAVTCSANQPINKTA
jgi:Tfp pilus assembly protein PilE